MYRNNNVPVESCAKCISVPLNHILAYSYVVCLVLVRNTNAPRQCDLKVSDLEVIASKVENYLKELDSCLLLVIAVHTISIYLLSLDRALWTMFLLLFNYLAKF